MPASNPPTLSLARRRAALGVLARDQLARLTRHFGLDVDDRRVSSRHIDALLNAPDLDFAEVLGRLRRDELAAVCQALGLDTSGRKKAVLVERILGTRTETLQVEATRADLGFEDKLWHAADLLRNNMDPAEYKHVVLGLIFLKYISDAFRERRAALEARVADPGSVEYIESPRARAKALTRLLENQGEYTSANVFWVPLEARWSTLRGHARDADIGKRLDQAMEAIEHDNPLLAGVLPKIYSLPNLDHHILGKLIDAFSDVGLGSAAHQAKDTLGRVYEYFLSRFASAEGKGGGEFYTPESVVRLLVEMLEPYRGRVYDPCCGSGGMFVQSLKFIEAHNGQRDAVTIYGQESNRTTWRMARMNLAIRGIEAHLGPRHADTFKHDLHPDLRAHFILANPPFNVSVWSRDQDDVRWAYGVPPANNANFAWVQHFVHHLEADGVAGFVLANGSMSSMQSGEGEIRRRLVEAELVDCIVACPSQLFYATQIPVCLWFLRKGRTQRRGHVLFIDARQLGRMDTRVHRVLDDADVMRIADTYHAWRDGDSRYQDVPGFCKAAGLEEIAAHEFVLTPGRYVGTTGTLDDDEPFEDKMARLTSTLASQFRESERLATEIMERLAALGWDES